MERREYWDVRSICEILRIAKVGVVLDAIHCGDLRASDVSRPGSRRPTWRIAQADLSSWLASRQPVPPAPATRRRRPKEGRPVTQYF